jgi:serine protease
MIVVSPGIYYERINFVGKAITVTSEQGPEVTIIDAQRSGTVVTFRSREGRDSVLSGFTIRGGYNISIGAGIQIGSSSPIVRGNTITDNIGCNGVGINTSFASPRIEANKIIRNAVQGYTGCWGIGVRIGGDSSAELIDNDTAENTSPGSSVGGGVALF